MAFDAGAIQGKMTLDNSGFTAALLQSEAATRLVPGWIRSFLASPLLGVIDLFKSAANSILSLIGEISDNQDNLRDKAQSLGVSTEFLSGWGQAAELAGSNTAELGESLKFISKSSAGAAEELAKGDPGANVAAYQRLGVSVLDAGGHLKSLEQLTREVQAGFARMPAGAERTAVALDILGRSGAGQLAFFGQAPAEINAYVERLQEMGAIVTDSSADQADAWNDLKTELDHAWGGIKRTIAEPLRDALMPYLESVLDWVRTHPAEIQAMAQSLADSIITGFNAIAGAANVLQPLLQVVIDNLGPIGLVAAAGLAVKAISGIVAAFRVASTAATIFKALSGPAGWATVVVGLGVAAVAVTRLENAFDSAAAKARALQGEGLRVADSTARVFSQRVSDLVEQANPAGASSANAAGGAAHGAAAAQGGVSIDVSVTAEVDPEKVATRVDDRIRAPLKRALDRKLEQMDSAVFRRSVSDALR